MMTQYCISNTLKLGNDNVEVMPIISSLCISEETDDIVCAKCGIKLSKEQIQFCSDRHFFYNSRLDLITFKCVKCVIEEKNKRKKTRENIN